MNSDELTRKLLQEEPRDWPDFWKGCELPDPLSSSEKEKILGAVQRAMQDLAQAAGEKPGAERKEPTGSAAASSRNKPVAAGGGSAATGKAIVRARFTPHRLAAAAIFLLVLGAGGFAYSRLFGPGAFTPYELETVEARGATELRRGATLLSLKKTVRIREGDRLFLKKHAGVSLTAGKALFYLQGPADVLFRKIRRTDELELVFFIEHGIIAVRSPQDQAPGVPPPDNSRPGGFASEKRRVAWESRGIVYILKGTVAELRVSEKGRTLSVLKGAFEVKSEKNPAQTVTAGQASVISMQDLAQGKPSETRPLSADNLAKLQALEARLARIAAGRPVLDARLRFNSEEEIFKHYGELHEVLLKDGRYYRGFAVIDGNLAEIHMILTTATLNRADVESIKRIK